MALSLEPLLTGSLIFVIIGYIFALGFQLYSLYLNYKQSQVNNQMTELIAEVQAIRKELQKQKKTTK